MKNSKKSSKIKKILPAVVLLGAGVLLTGCSNNLNHNDNKSNIADLKESITNYKHDVLSSGNPYNILNNYKLEISPITDKDLGEPIVKLDENGNPIVNDELDSSVKKAEIDDLTLYNLSTDIKENCQRYTALKNEIINAINETESLLNKVKNKEITLNSEQKMMLADQTKQLRSLSRQLTHITSKLNYNIDELNQNIGFMPLKYLVILNNLVDGNEMIENGLHSIEQINQTFYANRLNNMEGKITYRYQKEGEPSIYKEFELKDGKLTEINKAENIEIQPNLSEETNNLENKEDTINKEENKQIDNKDEENTEKTDIDSKQNNLEVDNKEQNQADEQNQQNNDDKQNNNNEQGENNQNNNQNGQFLNSNIDTFYPRQRNIDTFYNTANGMNGFGFNGMYGMENGFNGYGYNNMLGNNYGVANAYSTPNVVEENNAVNDENNNQTDTNKKSKKRLIKNVDTFRNADTPTPIARIKNFKTRVKNLIGK